jgi:subtilisin family serine protease
MRALAIGLLLTLLAALPAAGAAPTRDASREILVLVRPPPPHYSPGTAYGSGYGDDLSRTAERRLARRIAQAHGLALVDDWPMPLLGLDCFVMAAPDRQTAEHVVATLSKDPGVAWSEPMQVYRAEGRPARRGDPLFPVQPAAREWRLAELHRLATGRHVSVAVIDSQVDASQPDLAGQVAVSADFAPERARGGEAHGTGVAGVIAARADNGVGIVGVAPQARLMALRACWPQPPSGSTTVCDTLSLAKAMHFAIDHRAQIINLSLAGPPDLLLGKLLDVALTRRMTVVAAYDPHLPRGGFPASHAGVIAVADESLARLPPGVYIAPGRDVPTTQPGGRWSLVDGSSYAAAHVSGLMALARERAGASPRALALISLQRGGAAIDACATVALGAPLCARPAAGEHLASLHP